MPQDRWTIQKHQTGQLAGRLTPVFLVHSCPSPYSHTGGKYSHENLCLALPPMRRLQTSHLQGQNTSSLKHSFTQQTGACQHPSGGQLHISNPDLEVKELSSSWPFQAIPVKARLLSLLKLFCCPPQPGSKVTHSFKSLVLCTSHSSIRLAQ